MIIIGAGLSGLLAATQFQTAQVFEASPEGTTSHRALLRFRSSAVGDAVGIEFRKVRVHKGIWGFIGHPSQPHQGFVAPDIQRANLYSRKVLGRLGDRSIWNLDPVDRFIAPDNLMEQLIERVGKRIRWGDPVKLVEDKREKGVMHVDIGVAQTASYLGPFISTMPMSALVKQLDLKDTPEFSFSPIHVQRWTVRDADVFQTIYFPESDTPVYRASITGSTLIVEAMDEITDSDTEMVAEAFGIDTGRLYSMAAKPVSSVQRYGKIAPIDDAWRRKFIVEATRRLSVYSLGRFAIWKNILADDVLKDIAVIKRLLKGDAYGASLKGAGE